MGASGASKRCAAFGKLFREYRRMVRKTLRAFCRGTGLDPSSVSMVERGRLNPPTGEKLKRYAAGVGIEPGSAEWQKLQDAAAACRGEIPDEIMSDEELVGQLPDLFEMLRHDRPTDEDLEELKDLIRRS